MVNNIKKETSEKSAILSEKEKFYLEEDVSPEVRSVLDDVFAEMLSDDMDSTILETIPKKSGVVSGDEINNIISQDIMLEKEKLYAEEDISPEVKAVLDDVFAQMISDEDSEFSTEDKKLDEDTSNHKRIIVVEDPPEPESGEKDEKITELSSTINEYSIKINELEEKIDHYKDLVEDFEEKSNIMEDSKKQFEERLKELNESRNEFEERGKKLEQARESFKQLSKNLEEKRIGLEQREKNVNQMQRELDKIRQQVDSDSKKTDKIDNAILSYKDQKESISIVSENSGQTSVENWNDLDLIQMERGKVDILQDILQELLFQGDYQSCFLIDGQGMIISEYSKTELDALAIGAMFSLVCTTVLRTVRSLSLSELEYFKLSSINGEFILRNIDISNYERNFILLAYYNESNSNIPMKNQKLSKKTIRNILKSVKKDFNDSRKDSRISWIFDNLSDKIDFLKQKYNQFEGDINLVRLNLMNKASIKIRELFEM